MSAKISMLPWQPSPLPSPPLLSKGQDGRRTNTYKAIWVPSAENSTMSDMDQQTDRHSDRLTARRRRVRRDPRPVKNHLKIVRICYWNQNFLTNYYWNQNVLTNYYWNWNILTNQYRNRNVLTNYFTKPSLSFIYIAARLFCSLCPLEAENRPPQRTAAMILSVKIGTSWCD